MRADLAEADLLRQAPEQVECVSTVDLPTAGFRAQFNRCGFALFDQGLSSAANLTVTIALCRSLQPGSYGAFTLAFASLLVVGSLYTAAVIEPMMVFGSSSFERHFAKYVLSLLRATFIVTIPLAVTLVGFAAMISKSGDGDLARAFGGAAIALPPFLLLLLMRNAFYVRSQTRVAAIASGVNLSVVLGSCYWLSRGSGFSASLAFAPIGAGALLAGLFLIIRLGWREAFTCETIKFREIVQAHRSFAGWNVIATVATLTSSQLMPLLVVPMFVGLKAEAALGAVQNLFGPMNLFIRTVSTLLLPLASRKIRSSGIGQTLHSRVAHFWLLGVFLVAAMYGMFVVSLFKPVAHYMYQGRYDGYAPVGLLLAVSYIAVSVELVLCTGLKAAGQVRSLLWIRGVPAILLPLVLLPGLLTHSLNMIVGAFTLGGGLAMSLAFRAVLALDYSVESRRSANGTAFPVKQPRSCSPSTMSMPRTKKYLTRIEPRC
jgi:hypothetical protein